MTNEERERFVDLLTAYGNAMFSAGEWPTEDDNDDPYEAVSKQCKQAAAAIMAELDRLTGFNESASLSERKL